MLWNLQEVLSLLKAAQVIVAQAPENQPNEVTNVVRLISSAHRPPLFFTSHLIKKKKGRMNMMFWIYVWTHVLIERFSLLFFADKDAFNNMFVV